MLEALFGSKNIQKILIFLFVNRKCYGTQLHNCLKTALTPLQKGLQRLERGGIINCYYEGKTRLYQFNPAFPLLEELESLLKKSYGLLPPHEKKYYSFVRQERQIKELSLQEAGEILNTFWGRLASIKQLTFTAKSNSKHELGWNGTGKGDVFVSKEGENVLIYHEKGNWQGKAETQFDFSNVVRWTLDRETKTISLEHLRRGFNHPVFLFHLVPSGKHSLSSIDSHLCEGDAYFGHIMCDGHSLRLNWRVIGPKKNEVIDCYYI